MSWTPISNTPPQYEENGIAASGYYIKFYVAGTTTPTAMATDFTGGTLLDKCQLNSEGYPINGSSAVFLPHIDKKYKIALFRNEADADSNNLANAAWPIDNLFPFFTDSNTGTDFDQIPLNSDIVYPVANVTALRALTGIAVGQSFYLEGHTNPILGAGPLLATKPYASEVDDNGYLFVVDGIVIIRQVDGFVSPSMFGALLDGSDDSVATQAAATRSGDANIGVLQIDAGITIAKDVVYPGNITVRGLGKSVSTVSMAPGSSVYGAVFVSDRYALSTEALGRRASFEKLYIDGGKLSAITAHGIIACNYRQEINDCRIRNCIGDAVHMPNTLFDGTVITFNAVGPRVTNCRFSDVNSALNAINDAYSDGWFLNNSINDTTEYAVHIQKGSGWFIQNNHPDTMAKGFVSIDDASSLDISNNYTENFDTAQTNTPLYLLSGLRGGGINVSGNKGFINSVKTSGEIRPFRFSSSVNEVVSITCIGNNLEINSKEAAVDVIPMDISASSGSTMIIDHSHNNITEVQRPVRSSGSGIVQYTPTENSWQRVTSPDDSGFTGFISAGYTLQNIDPNSNIEGWVSVESGTGGGGATWSAIYKGISRLDTNDVLNLSFDVYVSPVSKHAFDVDINAAKFDDQDRRSWASYKVYIHSGSILAETPVIYQDVIVSPVGFSVAPAFALTSTAVTGIYTLDITGQSSNTDAKFGVTVK